MLSPGQDLPLPSNSMYHFKHCCKCRINQCPSVLVFFLNVKWTVIIQFKLLLYQPSLSLCQMNCLMPTLYDTTNPIPYRIKFSDPTIWAYHHENKTCTCHHLDWIMIHDILSSSWWQSFHPLFSWPGIIFQFLRITNQEPFWSTTQGSLWVAEFLITGSQYIPSTIISNHVSVDQFEVHPFLTLLRVESEGRPESEVRRRVGVGLTEYVEEGNG